MKTLFKIAFAFAITAACVAVMPAVYAQTQDPAVSIVNTAQNITAIGVAILSIAVAVIAWIRSKTGDQIISAEVERRFQTGLRNARATDDWLVEHEQKINLVISAVANISPEGKKFIAEHGVTLEGLDKESERVRQEVQTIYEQLGLKP